MSYFSLECVNQKSSSNIYVYSLTWNTSVKGTITSALYLSEQRTSEWGSSRTRMYIPHAALCVPSRAKSTVLFIHSGLPYTPTV